MSDNFKIYKCVICGYEYNEAEGVPDADIPAGTLWKDVPEDWLCPDCQVSKSDFEMLQ